MDGANFSIKKEVFMMENGKITTCMVMENFTTQMESWLMKDSGSWISFMEKEKSTMINLLKLMEALTLITLKISNKNGNITMELLFQIQNKGKES